MSIELHSSLKYETVEEIIRQIEEDVFDFGSSKSILIDYATSFRSEGIMSFCASWGVTPLYRYANRPASNGIIERVHRIIKRITTHKEYATGKIVYQRLLWMCKVFRLFKCSKE